MHQVFKDGPDIPCQCLRDGLNLTTLAAWSVNFSHTGVSGHIKIALKVKAKVKVICHQNLITFSVDHNTSSQQLTSIRISSFSVFEQTDTQTAGLTDEQTNGENNICFAECVGKSTAETHQVET